jgi:hypothetical protein
MPDRRGVSPEISTVNAVRWRMGIAEQRWRQAVELLREAAAAPGYSGPPLEVVERMAVVMAEIRGQVLNWQIEEHARRASRPRVMSRGQRNSVRRAMMVAPVGHVNHSPIDNVANFSYNFLQFGRSRDTM